MDIIVAKFDSFLTRVADPACVRCKVISGESLSTQHMLVVLDNGIRLGRGQLEHITKN